jgi:hypothetical protein
MLGFAAMVEALEKQVLVAKVRVLSLAARVHQAIGFSSRCGAAALRLRRPIGPAAT